MASSPTSTSQSLDAFQTQIESKLRQKYSSLELPKFLASNSSTSPKDFIHNLQKCFKRMTKPIQLRCLVGLLGFEPDVAKLYNDKDFDDAMQNFLETLESEKDKWVTVMAGIIRGKLFTRDLGGDDINDDDPVGRSLHQHDPSFKSGRNKTTDTIIKKAVDSIITALTEASSDAVDFRNEAEVALTTTDLSEADEKRMEKLLDSFHIGTDIQPTFVPWYYRLCSEAVITEAIPELDERCDFLVNEEADILKVDERLDRKKAQEEDREHQEEEQKLKLKALMEEKRKKNANKTATMLPPVKRRGVAGNSTRPAVQAKAGTVNDTAALMMRTKKTTSSLGPSSGVSGRLGSSTAAGGRARKAGFGRGAAANAIGGRSLANTMSKMRNLGGVKAMRKGATGTTINPGRNAVRNRTKMKMIDVAEVDVLKKEGEKRQQELTVEETKANKRRRIMEKASAKLKPKKRWVEKEESRLKNKNNVAADNEANVQQPAMPNSLNTNTSQELPNSLIENVQMNNEIHMNQSSQLDQSFIPMLAPNGTALQHEQINSALNLFNLDQNELLNPTMNSAENNMAMQQYQSINLEPHDDSHFKSELSHHQFESQPLPQQLYHQNQNQQHLVQHQDQDLGQQHQQDHYHQQQQPQPPQQHHQQHMQPSAHEPNWQSLLHRSNKLSSDDRIRVEQFFTTNPRYNPTPEISVYKMKLHESRTDDQQRNQTIKETLYLELDYGKGAYKMSRKKKEKAIPQH